MISDSVSLLPVLRFEVQRSQESSERIDIFKAFVLTIQPLVLRLEEKLVYRFVHLIRTLKVAKVEAEEETLDQAVADLSASLYHPVGIDDPRLAVADHSSRTAYFELLKLQRTQVTVTMFTNADLGERYSKIKKELGLGALVRFENAVIQFDDFVMECAVSYPVPPFLLCCFGNFCSKVV